MDEKVIPVGLYCYDAKGTCPYYTYKNVGEKKVPYCKFLKQGSLSNPTDEEFEYFKLFHKTSSDEDVWNLYPLNLLWDMVKECNINDEWEDDWEDTNV